MDSLFNHWKTENTKKLKDLAIGSHPKEVIAGLAEDLLETYINKALIDKYDIYQHLLSYWFETMQDDCYIVSVDGWKAETYRILVENKAKKIVDKGWTCDLVPKELVINRYFETEKQAIAILENEKEQVAAEIVEVEEEHNTEDGYFAELDKVNKAEITKRIKEVKTTHALSPEEKEELAVLNGYLDLLTKQTATNKKIKETETDLDNKLYAKYPKLTETEVKQLVVDDKWMQTIEAAIKGEIGQISQHLTNRIKELAERYETPLPQIDQDVTDLESKVNTHLKKMGFEL